MTANVVANVLGGTKPKIYVAKKQLAYPLYGADFDPLNHHFLLVGGGGGSSSTGVPNSITLLDTASRSEIKEVSEIKLPPDEDSVVSLAVADSDGDVLLVYAGINSSEKDQNAGKNEHFRSFRVPLPARRKIGTGDRTTKVDPTQALSRTAIFRSATGPKNECYQRVLKLSPPIVDDLAVAEREGSEKSPKRLKRRLTTIASGLAAQNEVVTFPVSDSPTAAQAISRINLEKSEAADADLTSTDDTDAAYALAYCTDYELFLQHLASTRSAKNEDSAQVYETQDGPKGRSKIRAIRWLNSRFLLLLQNRVNRSGVELVVLKVSKDYAQVQQMLIKFLSNLKQAVGLDVCALSKGQDGLVQFVVAIAGQDSSVQIHTLDWIAGKGITSFSKYADLVEVHNGPITRIVFSNFIPPKLPISSQTPPQYIRLATVGVDKTVSVQTFSLKPTPAAGTGKTNPRYVLTAPTEWGSIISSLIIGLIALLMGITFVISFFELRGAIPPLIGATKYLPQRWQDQYGRPYSYAQDNPGPIIPESMPAVQSVIDKIKLSEATPIIEKIEEIGDRVKLEAAIPVIEKLKEMESSIPSMDEVQDTLVDLVSQKKSDEKHDLKAVIIRDLEHIGGELSAELKHEAEVVREGTLKKWEHLTKKDQNTWKAKLKAAGHWTEKQGEAVLKGVFFGQLAGIVGEMARGG